MAVAIYAQLIDRYPASPLAAECAFRIGTANYAAGNFAAAVERFAVAQRSATDPELREKAAHKLAWCKFELKDFAAAQASFDSQVADQPHGSLAADGAAMAAECSFQQNQFTDALARFTNVLDDVSLSKSLRAMALVHADESAANVNQWQRSLDLADRTIAEFPTGDWADAAHYDRGRALYELGRLDEAERELSSVAAGEPGLASVKAEFTLGAIHVARHESDEAVRVFFKIAYGSGGTAAPPAFHPWQAEAIYAAARVLEDSGRQDAARKLYQEVVDDYPTSVPTAAARESLDRILRR